MGWLVSTWALFFPKSNGSFINLGASGALFSSPGFCNGKFLLQSLSSLVYLFAFGTPYPLVMTTSSSTYISSNQVMHNALNFLRLTGRITGIAVVTACATGSKGVVVAIATVAGAQHRFIVRDGRHFLHRRPIYLFKLLHPLSMSSSLRMIHVR